MKVIRFLYKLTATVLLIGLFFILALIVNILLMPSKFLRRKILTKICAPISKVLLYILGFRVKLVGEPPKNTGKMIIGNHMSYLDILVYLSFFEAVFVTSVETKHKPFLGQITVLAGCLFVERRNPRNLPNELKTIKKYFDKNLSVCIFPEGTSSNGDNVLPFKKSLFQLPIETKCPIQPILLNYTTIDGQKFSSENADSVCWHADNQSFFQHLLGVFLLKKVTAAIAILPQIDSSSFENRKEAADYCQNILTTAYTAKKSSF